MCNKFRKAGMLGIHFIVENSIPDFNVIVGLVFVGFHCTVDTPFFDFEPGGSSPRSENAGNPLQVFSKQSRNSLASASSVFLRMHSKSSTQSTGRGKPVLQSL